MVAWTTLGSVGIFAGSVTLSLALLHDVIRRKVLPQQDANRAMSPLGPIAVLQIICSLPIILVVYTLASIRAQFGKIVTWRGVRYRIVPPTGVQVLRYRPFGVAESYAMPHGRGAIDIFKEA